MTNVADVSAIADSILGVAALCQKTSLVDALQQIDYWRIRKRVSNSALEDGLRRNPKRVEQWLQYSEDKRTSGGWYVLRDGSVGCVAAATSAQSFGSVEEAVAEFVLKELDAAAGVALS